MPLLAVPANVDFLLVSTAATAPDTRRAHTASCVPVRSEKIHDASSTRSSLDSDSAERRDSALVEKIVDALIHERLFVATLAALERRLVPNKWHRIEEDL